MDNFYLVVALLTGGVCLALGSISLLTGISQKNKAELFFGAMCFTLFSFFLIPPVGFILDDKPPYPVPVIIKRVFIFSYYALIPWFVMSMSEYKKRAIPVAVTILTILTFFLMAFTQIDSYRQLWVNLALICFATIFAYGTMASLWRLKVKKDRDSLWLLTAMSVFGVLLIITVVNQLGGQFIQRMLGMKLFFPLHLHAICFLLIMGLKICVNLLERQRLELMLSAHGKRLQSFIVHAPMIVVEFGRDEKISFINDFGVRVLGRRSFKDIVGRNWIDTCCPASEKKIMRERYHEILRQERSLTNFKSHIQHSDGSSISIEWTFTAMYNEHGLIAGVMCLGADMTSEEKNSKLIHNLQLELEKEKIMPFEPLSLEHSDIIGESPSIQLALQKAAQVANTVAPVLLDGETGVGKELLADFIHKTSERSNKPFVKVNCGALPKDLVEDELFGHEKGAFTSALQSRKGRFELADGGTIFLDEIGELPLQVQPILLRVLQDGEFQRVGGQRSIKVNVRIIAATNRNLVEDVKAGRFREDLFFRLNVFPIRIPPLRERSQDLPLLINYFITSKSKEYAKSFAQFSRADLNRLLEYQWPGNIRELRNVIERSVISSHGDTLKLDLSFPSTNAPSTDKNSDVLEHVERDHILKVLESTNWRINGDHGAADKLQMHPNTLRSKMKRLGIFRTDHGPLN